MIVIATDLELFCDALLYVARRLSHLEETLMRGVTDRIGVDAGLASGFGARIWSRVWVTNPPLRMGRVATYRRPRG